MISSRRKFIRNTAISTTGSLLFGKLLAGAMHAPHNDVTDNRPRSILLRSGWQVENIGDIAHTPSMLALIAKNIPGAKVTFWPWYDYMPDAEREMLLKYFPELTIVQGKLDAAGKASTPELEAAITSADFFLHNSAPATIAWADAAAFKKRTGNSFGVYGITYGLYGTPERDTLSDAAFVYFRDSVSLQKAKEAGVHAPIMGFTPDAVFAIDIADDEKATAFLTASNLQRGKFLCCIPKQRYTPVWLHPHKGRPFDADKNARNEAMKEHDHQPMRDAITAVVRNTDLKILICHEDETEMPIGKDWLLNKLPEDVKPKVVWLGRPWLPDEAVSIYKQSAGLFSHEMHSPIMCIANGIPAIVVRWEEQSSKGIMWKDIGLGDWLFDFDKEEDIARYVPAVLAMARHPESAKAKAGKAKNFVQKHQKETMKIVEQSSRPQKQTSKTI